MTLWVYTALLTFLAVTAFAMVRMRSVFAVVMLSGLYSLLSAGLFVVMDAVDVAFTEAAVGAGISTVLMLGALSLTTRHSKGPTHGSALPLLVCLVTGAALIYGTLDLPAYGEPDTPVHRHVGAHYLAEAKRQTGVPNVVTAVLASYRGYDTFGEVVVVFTAGLGVLALLGGRRHWHRRRHD